jgi:hypothetical protein
VDHFVPQPLLTADQLAAEHVREIRWWSTDELASTRAAFSPRGLPRLLAELLDNPVPSAPIRLDGF